MAEQSDANGILKKESTDPRGITHRTLLGDSSRIVSRIDAPVRGSAYVLTRYGLGNPDEEGLAKKSIPRSSPRGAAALGEIVSCQAAHGAGSGRISIDAWATIDR